MIKITTIFPGRHEKAEEGKAEHSCALCVGVFLCVFCFFVRLHFFTYDVCFLLVLIVFSACRCQLYPFCFFHFLCVRSVCCPPTTPSRRSVVICAAPLTIARPAPFGGRPPVPRASRLRLAVAVVVAAEVTLRGRDVAVRRRRLCRPVPARTSRRPGALGHQMSSRGVICRVIEQHVIW